MKILLRLMIIVMVVCFQPLKAQHNPYLRKKARNKPSAILARQNKKDVKRQKKNAKRQMRRSRKRVNK